MKYLNTSEDFLNEIKIYTWIDRMLDYDKLSNEERITAISKLNTVLFKIFDTAQLLKSKVDEAKYNEFLVNVQNLKNKILNLNRKDTLNKKIVRTMGTEVEVLITSFVNTFFTP